MYQEAEPRPAGLAEAQRSAESTDDDVVEAEIVDGRRARRKRASSNGRQTIARYAESPRVRSSRPSIVDGEIEPSREAPSTPQPSGSTFPRTRTRPLAARPESAGRDPGRGRLAISTTCAGSPPTSTTTGSGHSANRQRPSIERASERVVRAAARSRQPSTPPWQRRARDREGARSCSVRDAQHLSTCCSNPRQGRPGGDPDLGRAVRPRDPRGGRRRRRRRDRLVVTQELRRGLSPSGPGVATGDGGSLEARPVNRDWVDKDFYQILGVQDRPAPRRSRRPTASWPRPITPTPIRATPRPRRSSRRSPRPTPPSPTPSSARSTTRCGAWSRPVASPDTAVGAEGSREDNRSGSRTCPTCWAGLGASVTCSGSDAGGRNGPAARRRRPGRPHASDSTMPSPV